MPEFKEALPLSLYIHLPWCVKKCPYCDFNSHEFNGTELDEENYIAALIRDLESELPRIWGRQISSIFIGGGTPSLFSAKALDTLLAGIRARLNHNPNIEITLEANPGTAEATKFYDYKQIGINRLSLCIQSFNDAQLQALGRFHDAEQVQSAIELLKQSGFNNFNIDLMFGLPGQTLSEAMKDLRTAIEQQPTHLSWYQLTIEPNTVFYAKPPVLPDDNVLWEIQESGQACLSDAGYRQYEISAYATDKNACKHNMNYWEFGDYLGIGAGAHGKLTQVADASIQRFKRHKMPARYMELAGTEHVITETKTLNKDDLSLEFMMNAMRLSAGIDIELFSQRTGLSLTIIDDRLAQAQQAGLIENSVDMIKPTAKGLRYLNELLEVFVQ